MKEKPRARVGGPRVHLGLDVTATFARLETYEEHEEFARLLGKLLKGASR